MTLPLVLAVACAAEPVPPTNSGRAGWISVGVGAAVVAGGGALYGLARVDGDSVKDSAGIFLLGAGLGAASAALHWAGGPGNRQAAWVPFLAGAIMLAAGGALYGLARVEPLGAGLVGLGTGALLNSNLLWLLGG